MKLSKGVWLLLMAVILAIIAASVWPALPLSQRLSALRVDALLQQAPALRKETPAVLAVVAGYQHDDLLLLQARSALLQTPVLARKLLPIYGHDAMFRQALARWGSEALLPIAYFYDHQIATLVARRYVGHHYQQVKQHIQQQLERWLGDADKPQSMGAMAVTAATPGAEQLASQSLTPKARGHYAIGLIQRDGLRFMSQFQWQVGGQVLWLQSQRAIEDVGDFLVGGIRRVEVKTRTNQAVTGGDIGWALVDIAAVAWPLLKTADLLHGAALARAGRLAADTKLGTRGAAGLGKKGQHLARGESRWGKLADTGAATARVAGRGAGFVWRYRLLVGAGVVWMAVTHPGIISDLLARLADWWGLPTLPVVMAGWFLLLWPLLYVLHWLGRLLLPLRRLRRWAR